MKVSEFVTQSINEIMDAIRDLNDHEIDQGRQGAGAEAPAAAGAIQKYHLHGADAEQRTGIKFSIAVTATEGQEVNAGAGLKVWGVAAGGEVRGIERNETVSRIEFTVYPAFAPVKRQGGN